MRGLYILLLLSLGQISCSSHFEIPTKVCFENKCVRVEVVMDRAKWAVGLMGRKFMEKDAGMLFRFPSEDYYSFWMKDMLFPLDIIWLDEKRRVSYIAVNVQPCTRLPCDGYAPSKPGRYVLEVNAHTAERMGIKTGDKAEFR